MTDFIKIQSSFNNNDLLSQALTHRSWLNEHPKERESNERLEFLGDAILEFVVSKYLYEKFPSQKEGYLTALRANLVNTVSLAKISAEIGLGENLFLSKGEEEGGGRSNTSLLADTLEAVIGAIYLDGGLTKVEEFLEVNLFANLNKLIKQPLKDSKSRLQEYIQGEGLPAPKYKVVKEIGPDHNKAFEIEVIIHGKPIAKGTGKSKSESEQAAAEAALVKMAKNS